MKRIIVDYAKLTNEILTMLVEKFPDGYDDSDIIRFKNAKNETIEAVEVKTDDTIYLVKVSTKLSDRIVNFDEDEEIVIPVETINLKDIDLETEDDEEEEKKDLPEFDDEDEDADKTSNEDFDEDEDE